MSLDVLSCKVYQYITGKPLPYDIVYTDDILFIAVLIIDDHSGADLDPSVATSFVEETEVRTHDLALLDYCGDIIRCKS